jgi:hypothetical protein
VLPSTMPRWCSRVRMQPQQLLLSSRQPQPHHHNQHSSMRQQLQPQMLRLCFLTARRKLQEAGNLASTAVLQQ